MANLDFYAVEKDIRDLLAFIFEETDIQIYELSSAHNQEAKSFRSIEEMESFHKLGLHGGPLLQLWSPSVTARPIPRRIEMPALAGKPFRYAIEGVGLMQLYLDGVSGTTIFHSHFGHWNEAGAGRALGAEADSCNWAVLTKVSGLIQRHIKRKLKAAQLYSRPILSDTYSKVKEGSHLSYAAQLHSLGSPEIEVVMPNKSSQPTR